MRLAEGKVLWALAGIVGLYILWKLLRVELGLRLPAKAKGRSYLYVQLSRMGIREQDVSADIVDAAVELAEIDATDVASGKWNPQIFCEALDGYARVIEEKLKRAPMDSFAERIWDLIHSRSIQPQPRTRPGESRRPMCARKEPFFEG